MPVALPLAPTEAGAATPATLSTGIAPSPTPASLIGRVALVRTDDRAEGVRRALDILGINPVQEPGSQRAGSALDAGTNTLYSPPWSSRPMFLT